MAAVKQSDVQVSEAEYFALEKHTEIRHELLDGQVYAMVGGSFNHVTLTGTLAGEIRTHLKGNPCRVFAESIKLKIPQIYRRANYVYPDVVVDCSIDQADGDMLTTPVLIIEVLSKSTHRRDKVAKRNLYEQIASLQEYILIEQDVAEVSVCRRRTGWLIEELFLGDSVSFESIGLTLSVEDIYNRVNNEEMTEWLAEKASGQQD